MTGARLPSAAGGPGYGSDTTLVGETNKPVVSFNVSDAPPAFPNADYCLAHLQLLSVFHALKEDVGYNDGLFNLWDIRWENAENREETLVRMREKRWALYVARAVERFEDWWLQVLVSREPSKRLEAKEMISTNLEFRQWTRKGRVRQWTRAMLPPIGGIFDLSFHERY